MGKKQRERKERRLAQRRPGIPQPSAEPLFTGPVSPQARRVLDRLARAPQFDENRAIQVLMASADLRDEPEFEDLYFEVAAVSRALARVMPRYQSKLERAAAQGQDAQQQVYDDARIEMIEQVATREFRREFLRRYDRMLNRLAAGIEMPRFEQAVLLRPLLQNKTFPWGIVGLVTRIFSETQQTLLEPVVDSEETIEQLQQVLGDLGSADELLTRLQNPAASDALMARIESSEQARAVLQEHAERILQNFEEAIFKGAIELDLFTPDEIAQSMLELVQARKQLDASLGNPNADAVRQNTDRILAHKLDTLVTPERLAQMTSQLAAVRDEWYHSGNPHAPSLDMEISDLADMTPSENPFLQSLLRASLQKLIQVHETTKSAAAQSPSD